MDKKRYEIEVAGVQLAIISDEREEFVNTVVEIIDKEIKDITAATKRSSNLDAAILCAISYYSDKVKAEKRARNLEAQIALYDTNLRRFRNENCELKRKIAELSGENCEATDPVEGENASEAANDTSDKEESAVETVEEKAEENTENKETAENDSRAARLRAIDELLGRNTGKE